MMHLQPSQGSIRRVSLFGVPIDCLDMQETLCAIESFIQVREPKMIVTADSAAVVTAQSDDEFMEILQNAALVTPDSAGVVWALNRELGKNVSKVSGIDLVEKICAFCSQKGYRIFLLGAKSEVAALAAQQLLSKHPKCQIVGTHHGYFSPEEDISVAQEIAKFKPDVLLVAMGMPRQEKFIAKTCEIIQAAVSIGVGGSLDVFSGKTKRAPEWVQGIHMEWFWRLLRDPKKINKVKLLPKFVWMVFRKRC